jgi:hypothetical protein
LLGADVPSALPDRKESLMATYRINGTATLYTTIEPEGYLSCDGVEDFDDDTSYSYEEVRQEIAFSFNVQAASEEDALDKAETDAQDLRFESQDIEWEIDDIQITDAVRTSPEPTLAEALQIVRDYLAGSDMDDEVREAFTILLGAIETLITNTMSAPDEEQPTAF